MAPLDTVVARAPHGVRIEALPGQGLGVALPLVLRPDGRPYVEDLVGWLTEHRRWVHDAMRRHGAVLLRGFALDHALAFERVALAIEPGLSRDYLGTSPRDAVTSYVFNASELPNYYPIPQHCEMTFVRQPPRRIFFACLRAPLVGGETPLVDGRLIAKDLDPAVLARFVSGGIRIIRNYAGPESPRAAALDPWKLKRWDEMFATRDRARVEQICDEQGFTPTWRPEGRLRLVSEHDALRPHPETGEPVWFNHVQVFHLRSAGAELRRVFQRRGDPRDGALALAISAAARLRQRVQPAEDLPLHCTYRDGREIPDADLEHLRDVIWRNMVIEPWQRGDVVAVDNASVAHGRLPYRGPRKVVVAWA
jgi:alpha-ketoglutarate-dependent taurine dioxygenase